LEIAPILTFHSDDFSGELYIVAWLKKLPHKAILASKSPAERITFLPFGIEQAYKLY
jgi:hypothetical protein